MTSGVASSTAAKAVLRDEGASVELTRGQLFGLATVVSRELASRGVGSGDVVLVQLGNTWQFVVLHLALRTLGAVIAPVPPVWRDAEVRDAVRATRAAWLVSSTRDDVVLRVASSARAGDGSVVSVDGLRYPVAVPDETGEYPVTGSPAPALLASSVVESGVRWIQHSHRSADFGLARCAAAWGLSARSRILVGAHVGFLAGFQWGVRLGLALGAEITLLPAWDAPAAARAVDSHGCDFMYGTGRQLAELLDRLAPQPRRDMVFVLAASQPSPELVDQADRLGVTVVATYGQPESFLMATCRRADPASVRGATRGRALPGTSLHTRHHPATPDGPAWAEITTTGPHVGTYLDRGGPEDSKRTSGSTLVTGEEGWLDESGHLHWVRSRARTIVRSGVVISPREVAATLLACPGVLDARVRGVDSVRHGQEVLAELRVATGVDEATVRALLRERRVARHKVPDRIELVGVDHGKGPGE